MAVKGSKTYSFSEVVEVLVNGEDMAATMEVTRYYPLLVMLLMPLVAKAGAELYKLVEHFPEHITANKIDTALRGQITDEDGTPKSKGVNTTYQRKVPSDSPYAGIKPMGLYKMAKEKGLDPEMRQSAAYYIELLEAAEKGGKGKKHEKAKAKKPVIDPDEEEFDDDEEEEDTPPPAKRKAGRPPKKPVKPEPEDEDEDEEFDDDFEDEEEETPPPKKSPKKPKKPVEDDDDSWDM